MLLGISRFQETNIYSLFLWLFQSKTWANHPKASKWLMEISGSPSSFVSWTFVKSIPLRAAWCCTRAKGAILGFVSWLRGSGGLRGSEDQKAAKELGDPCSSRATWAGWGVASGEVILASATLGWRKWDRLVGWILISAGKVGAEWMESLWFIFVWLEATTFWAVPWFLLAALLVLFNFTTLVSFTLAEPLSFNKAATLWATGLCGIFTSARVGFAWTVAEGIKGTDLGPADFMAEVAGATEVAGAEWLTEDNSANGSFGATGAEWLTEANSANGSFGVAGALLEAKSANRSFSATGAEWLTEDNSANGSFGATGAEWLTEANSANGSFGVAGPLLEAKSANGSFSATGAEWLTEDNSANGSFGVAGALLEANSANGSFGVAGALLEAKSANGSFSATGAEWLTEDNSANGSFGVAGALLEANSANGSFGVAGALLEAKSANGSFSATGAEWLTEDNSANGSFLG